MVTIPRGVQPHVVVCTDHARHQAVQIDALEKWSSDQASNPSLQIALETPVEALYDAWAVFRTLRSALHDRGRLSLQTSRAHGHGLRPYYLKILLQLSGYSLLSWQKSRLNVSVIAEKRPVTTRELTCTVVVPCKNEEDNVAPLVERLPGIGTRTELIFVDGASTDGTVDRVQHLIAENRNRDIRLLHQQEAGGKAQAVFQGFNHATGDVLIILDADMTVAPEDLPRFFLALAEGAGEFANGTRFAYPMERGAMPPINNLGNRAFSGVYSWLLGRKISDTLCGTKALFRSDWLRIQKERPRFGGHDPWGDFDLLLGAGRLSLATVEIPVRYASRVAGESKMRPLRHGAVLAKTTAIGAQRLKIEPWMRRRSSG